MSSMRGTPSDTASSSVPDVDAKSLEPTPLSETQSRELITQLIASLRSGGKNKEALNQLGFRRFTTTDGHVVWYRGKVEGTLEDFLGFLQKIKNQRYEGEYYFIENPKKIKEFLTTFIAKTEELATREMNHQRDVAKNKVREAAASACIDQIRELKKFFFATDLPGPFSGSATEKKEEKLSSGAGASPAPSPMPSPGPTPSPTPAPRLPDLFPQCLGLMKEAKLQLADIETNFHAINFDLVLTHYTNAIILLRDSLLLSRGESIPLASKAGMSKCSGAIKREHYHAIISALEKDLDLVMAACRRNNDRCFVEISHICRSVLCTIITDSSDPMAEFWKHFQVGILAELETALLSPNAHILRRMALRFYSRDLKPGSDSELRRFNDEINSNPGTGFKIDPYMGRAQALERTGNPASALSDYAVAAWMIRCNVDEKASCTEDEVQRKAARAKAAARKKQIQSQALAAPKMADKKGSKKKLEAKSESEVTPTKLDEEKAEATKRALLAELELEETRKKQKEIQQAAKAERKAKRAAETRRVAEETARREAEEAENRRVAEEAAKKEAEEAEARRVAEETARREAQEAETRRLADAAAKKEAEEAETRRLADAAAKKEAEEAEARRVAEETARREAQEAEARRAAEETAKREAEAADARIVAEAVAALKAKKAARRAERQRLADEAEHQRLADETETQRLAEDIDSIWKEGETQRLAEEQMRLTEEKAKMREEKSGSLPVFSPDDLYPELSRDTINLLRRLNLDVEQLVEREGLKEAHLEIYGSFPLRFAMLTLGKKIKRKPQDLDLLIKMQDLPYSKRGDLIATVEKLGFKVSECNPVKNYVKLVRPLDPSSPREGREPKDLPIEITLAFKGYVSVNPLPLTALKLRFSNANNKVYWDAGEEKLERQLMNDLRQNLARVDLGLVMRPSLDVVNLFARLLKFFFDYQDIFILEETTALRILTDIPTIKMYFQNRLGKNCLAFSVDPELAKDNCYLEMADLIARNYFSEPAAAPIVIGFIEAILEELLRERSIPELPETVRSFVATQILMKLQDYYARNQHLLAGCKKAQLVMDFHALLVQCIINGLYTSFKCGVDPSSRILAAPLIVQNLMAKSMVTEPKREQKEVKEAPASAGASPPKVVPPLLSSTHSKTTVALRQATPSGRPRAPSPVRQADPEVQVDQLLESLHTASRDVSSWLQRRSAPPGSQAVKELAVASPEKPLTGTPLKTSLISS